MLMLATVFQSILAFLFVVVGLLMIGIILLQKNRGAGLSGAFGGVGGHSAFGTKTGDFLTWITVGFTAALILLAVVANYAFTPTSSAEALGIAAPPAAPAFPSGMPQPSSPISPTPGASQTIRIPAQPQPSSPQPASPGPSSPVPAPSGAAPSTPPSGSPAAPPAPTGGDTAKP